MLVVISVAPPSLSAAAAASLSAATSPSFSASAAFTFSTPTSLPVSTLAAFPVAAATTLLSLVALLLTIGARGLGVLLSRVDREQHEEADATFRCQGGGRGGAKENINTV